MRSKVKIFHPPIRCFTCLNSNKSLSFFCLIYLSGCNLLIFYKCEEKTVQQPDNSRFFLFGLGNEPWRTPVHRWRPLSRVCPDRGQLVLDWLPASGSEPRGCLLWRKFFIHCKIPYIHRTRTLKSRLDILS